MKKQIKKRRKYNEVLNQDKNMVGQCGNDERIVNISRKASQMKAKRLICLIFNE